jgi:[acyl-carrier-protein] S-malonyltransferase
MTAEIQVGTPDTPIYSPQLGRRLRTPGDIRELLAGLLVLPVAFRQTLRRLYDDGFGTFVECGARTVLSDLVGATLPAAARAVPLLPGPAAARAVAETIAALRAAPPRPAAPPADAPTRPDPSRPRERALPPTPELVEQVRQAYAEVLQYPLEVIAAEAELEADLGVSSVMQTQVLVRLLDQYGLPTPSADVRLFSYRTVAQVAGLLQRLASEGR